MRLSSVTLPVPSSMNGSLTSARRITVWLSEGRFAVEGADCVFQKGKCGKGKATCPPKTKDD